MKRPLPGASSLDAPCNEKPAPCSAWISRCPESQSRSRIPCNSTVCRRPSSRLSRRRRYSIAMRTSHCPPPPGLPGTGCARALSDWISLLLRAYISLKAVQCGHIHMERIANVGMHLQKPTSRIQSQHAARPVTEDPSSPGHSLP